METSGLIQERAQLLAKFGNSPPMLAQVLSVYLDSWREDYEAFEQALTAEDLPRAAKKLHRLKGSVGYFATEDFFHQIQKIEDIAKEGDLEAARELRSSLQQNLEQAEVQLLSIRGSLT